ncbi:MAG TPA: hypothetical protein VKA85_10495 [Candidatus Limnocylindrales bacterium]|nr:hypothetical protein [Candidatus Limnocylindrales bacterium]
MTMNSSTQSSSRSKKMNGGTASGDRLQEAASGIADQATRTAEAQATNTMAKAGDALQQVAQAIRDGSQQLREQRPEFAGVADTAAQKVEDASAYLKQHDAAEVASYVQDFARRQPAMVIVGGLGLGLLVGRFLRSGSSTSQYGGDYGQSYGSGYSAGRTYADTYGGTGTTGYGAGAGTAGSTAYGTGTTGYDTMTTTADSDTMSMETAGLTDTGADDELGGTAGSGTADSGRRS